MSAIKINEMSNIDAENDNDAAAADDGDLNAESSSTGTGTGKLPLALDHFLDSTSSIDLTKFPVPSYNEPIQLSIPANTFLNSFPSLFYQSPYNERPNLPFSPQLSLLLSEIQFLNEYGYSNAKIIIIHEKNYLFSRIELLIKLFPELEFHIYDSNNNTHNNNNTNNHNNKEIIASNCYYHFNELFNEQYISPFQHQNNHNNNQNNNNHNHCLLISHVSRLFGRDLLSSQRYLIELFQPIYSLMKIRFPWDGGESEFYNGKLYFPIWTGPNSAELRIVIDGNHKMNRNSISSSSLSSSSISLSELIHYGHTKFEQKMFYFNSVIRFGKFNNTIITHQSENNNINDNNNTENTDNINNNCQCWDCTGQNEILKQYISRPDHLYQLSRILPNIIPSIIDSSISLLSILNSLNSYFHMKFPRLPYNPANTTAGIAGATKDRKKKRNHQNNNNNQNNNNRDNSLSPNKGNGKNSKNNNNNHNHNNNRKSSIKNNKKRKC